MGLGELYAWLEGLFADAIQDSRRAHSSQLPLTIKGFQRKQWLGLFRAIKLSTPRCNTRSSWHATQVKGMPIPAVLLTIFVAEGRAPATCAPTYR